MDQRHVDPSRGRGGISKVGGKPIAASELAKLGYCEAKTLFDRQYGERPTKLQVARKQDGKAAHRRFHRDALEYGVQGSDRRCYIATYVFGVDAPETNALRAFRDRALLPRAWCRPLVRAYYISSPLLCRLFPLIPGAAEIARSALRRLVFAIEARDPCRQR
jgi:hypothetical protein